MCGPPGKISWDRSAHTHTVRPALVRARGPPSVSPGRVGVGALFRGFYLRSNCCEAIASELTDPFV
jgi:hypothetical protein